MLLKYVLVFSHFLFSKKQKNINDNQKINKIAGINHSATNGFVMRLYAAIFENVNQFAGTKETSD